MAGSLRGTARHAACHGSERAARGQGLADGFPAGPRLSGRCQRIAEPSVWAGWSTVTHPIARGTGYRFGSLWAKRRRSLRRNQPLITIAHDRPDRVSGLPGVSEHEVQRVLRLSMRAWKSRFAVSRSAARILARECEQRRVVLGNRQPEPRPCRRSTRAVRSARTELLMRSAAVEFDVHAASGVVFMADSTRETPFPVLPTRLSPCDSLW
jgi:hypothetical protein